MLHFRKRATAASVIFALALPVLLSCTEAGAGIVDPPEGPQIVAVAVTLDSTSLAVGHIAQAAATAIDTTGQVITGREVTWTSLAPEVAAISSAGVVSAIAPGSAAIQALVAGKAGVATLTVVVPPAPEPAPAPQPPPVATVTVTLDSTSLTVGNATRAVASAVDAAGNVITGQDVIWTSLSPAVATVSSSGAVTAIAAGSASIEGVVGGKAGAAALTVIVPPPPPAPPAPPPVSPPAGAVSHDFNDGTAGAFVNVWEDGGIDFPSDPTGSGRGKVARMHYSPAQGNPGVQASDDTDLAYNRSATRVRYNETVWMRGEVYLPYSGSTVNANHNRKLIDFTGAGSGGIHTRVTLHRRDMNLMVSYVDWMGGSVRETISEWSGITLADDTWHKIEVRLTTNSADKVRDGILEIYMNGSSTPAYSRTTNIGWITEAFPGGTFFSYFYFGSQLTVDPNEPVYTEYRYWDNIAFSSTRIGF